MINELKFGGETAIVFIGWGGGIGVLSTFSIYIKTSNYHHIFFLQKSHSMPASGVARSGDINSTSSSSKSLCLSTENIDRVFKQCSKKYQSKLIENAEKELEQLKTYVRKFSSREEMVIFFYNLREIQYNFLFNFYHNKLHENYY